jgi:hypothetical protein
MKIIIFSIFTCAISITSLLNGISYTLTNGTNQTLNMSLHTSWLGISCTTHHRTLAPNESTTITPGGACYATYLYYHGPSSDKYNLGDNGSGDDITVEYQSPNAKNPQGAWLIKESTADMCIDTTTKCNPGSCQAYNPCTKAREAGKKGM